MNCGTEISRTEVWEIVCVSQVTYVVEVRFIDMLYILNLWSSGMYFRNPQPRHDSLLDESCKVVRPVSNPISQKR